jgi:TPR repeat protein
MRIFLSYAMPDKSMADAVKTAIEAAMPGSEVFVAHRDLRFGARWQPQLASSIASADAFIILLGAKIGRWQTPEYDAALNRFVTEDNFRLVPVLIADETPALPFLSNIQFLKAREPARDPALSKIIAALRGEKIEGEQPLWLMTNPYRGLESLREEDADYFFGREEETEAALNLLGSPVNGMVTLIGNSGVGKSSLVEAGVYAALKRQKMPTGAPWPHTLRDSRDWATITMQPGEDPIQTLVAAFMDLWFGDMTDPDRIARRNRWAKLFRDGEAGIKDIAQATFDRFARELAMEAPRRILLNINQAEELYSLTPEPLRATFSKLIAQALTDRRIAVIASLRADYYGHHQANAPLFEHMARIDVRPFSEDGLKRVIDGPAQVLGARFESEELASFIVRGAAGQSGALPLLAFYMTDLWERMQKRGDGVLRLVDKAEMVDVGRALTNQADRFLAQHPTDIDAVKRLFTLKLALVQEEGKAVRRRVARSKLDAGEWRLVELLAHPDWRLVTAGEDDDGQPYAEVAHEVLLQNWATLAKWLDDERDFLSFKARAERARQRWDAAKRDNRALLSGLDLIQAEQWLATRERDLDTEEAAYIRESVRLRDLDLRRTARFRRRVQWASASAAVVMTGVSFVAVWGWREANLARDAARVAEERAVKESASAVEALDDLGLAFTQTGKIDYMRAFGAFYKSANKGSPFATFALGVLYEKGQGVQENFSEARRWYEKAVDLGASPAMTRLGYLYETGKGVPQDYGKAREWYEKAAANDNTDAMVNLGLLYNTGRGVTKDYAKARELYERAAAKENAYAMRNLGLLYASGKGVAQDYAKAREWYEKAAANNNTDAMFNLGLLYETGEGVAQDYDKALEWYEKAASKDNGYAKAKLNILYSNGKGVPRDYVKAREWYEKAAAKDNTDAMVSVGVLYETGKGVAQDYAKAREWYEKAAAKDNTGAMFNLGLLLETGKGVTQDYTKAREWYEKAAAKDNTDAMVGVGVLYETGKGVTQDYGKAREWYEKAAANDNTNAMFNLGRLYDTGEGVTQDYAKAREWYERAAAKDDIDAMRQLATLWQTGKAGTIDYLKAFEWAKKAVEVAEANDLRAKRGASSQTTRANTALSFNALFTREYAVALSAADKALGIEPENLVPATNKAHALMFLGRTDQARSLYLAHKGKPIGDTTTWNAEILNDFAEFEKAGLTMPPLAAEIRTAFAASAPNPKQ